MSKGKFESDELAAVVPRAEWVSAPVALSVDGEPGDLSGSTFLTIGVLFLGFLGLLFLLAGLYRRNRQNYQQYEGLRVEGETEGERESKGRGELAQVMV